MKTGSMLMKLFIIILALGTVLVIWISWNPSPAGAADHLERRGFGLVSVNPGQVARLNVFSLRIHENQIGEQHSDAEEARPRRITIAFDVYAPSSESARPATASSDNTCATPLRFVTRRSCEVTLPRGDAVTWDFTAPAEGAVIRAVVNPASFDPHIISSLEIREGGRTTHFINPNIIDP
jgi:hypothetical protein